MVTITKNLAAAGALLATAASSAPTPAETNAALEARDSVDSEIRALVTTLAWWVEVEHPQAYIFISPNWDINQLYVHSMKTFGGGKCGKKAWRCRTQEDGKKVPDGAIWICHSGGWFPLPVGTTQREDVLRLPQGQSLRYR